MRVHFPVFFAGLLPLLGGIAAAQDAAPIPTGFLNKTLEPPCVNARYVVYVPCDYTPEKAWPLIVFLHGAGERGDNGLAQTQVGIGAAIRFNPERFPAIVLMPQCPLDKFYDCLFPDIERQMDKTRAEYTIDPKRIYLTGISMGGYGTWLWGALKSDVFAALMPICGGGSPLDLRSIISGGPETDFGSIQDRVKKLVAMPIWAFHGADDTVVPPSRSKQMIRMIAEAGGAPKYTEFKKTGHDSWTQAYADEEAIAWLFAQHK